MCGLSGIYRLDQQEIDRERITEMTRCLTHRGPDAEGFYFSAAPHRAGSVALGFRRLAIIDLSSGNQPMPSFDGRYHIAFNGEIYNFLELRQTLEAAGYPFKTRSDTEVILALYAQDGAACLEKLNGMFALAIYDTQTRALFLARDRGGKKPFFYAWNAAHKALYFSSEIKALLRVPGLSGGVRLESLSHYLTYQFVPGPETIFKNIRQLPPAHFLKISAGGKENLARYWDAPRQPKTRRSIADLKAEVLHRLETATRQRMIADVPLGAFLSGGIDSSAVVALMSRNSSQPVKTFSIGFKEEQFSELAFARTIAEKFQTDHHEFVVEPKATEILPKLAWHYDQPFADPSALPSYYVAQQTRQHVTVALNGDGGDEAFGGYLRYRANFIFSRLLLLPQPLRKGLAAALSKVPSSRSNFWLRSLARFGDAIGKSKEEFNFSLFAYFNPQELKTLLSPEVFTASGAAHTPDFLQQLYRRIPTQNFLDAVFEADARGYLTDCLMVKMDIASMANSLEARSPFLDKNVVELAATIPTQYKVKWNGGKWILKEALKDLLPAEILDRRKMGFGIPVNEWFAKDLNGFWKDHVLSPSFLSRGWFDASALRRLMQEHEQGQRNHGYKLWALLMLDLWCRNVLDTASN